MYVLQNLLAGLLTFYPLIFCLDDIDITHYINIFETCLVEIIDNVLLPRNERKCCFLNCVNNLNLSCVLFYFRLTITRICEYYFLS